MGAEIINLRKTRKRKARVEKAELAAENRRRFGRSKTEKAEEAAFDAQHRKFVDGHFLQTRAHDRDPADDNHE